MSNKRKLNHQYKILKKIKPRYFLILSVLFLAVGIVSLRQNNYHMIQLRDAVATADKQNGDVEGALRDLREYVYSHMNTDLSSGNNAIKPPIQLKYRYERLVANEEKDVKAENEKVKQAGERVCAKKFPASGLNPQRVKCVAAYINSNSVISGSVPSDLYKFDFVSPVWSPDRAGLSLLASLIFFAAFITRSAVGLWYRYELD